MLRAKRGTCISWGATKEGTSRLKKRKSIKNIFLVKQTVYVREAGLLRRIVARIHSMQVRRAAAKVGKWLD